mgnify:CR=1 FL=1
MGCGSPWAAAAASRAWEPQPLLGADDALVFEGSAFAFYAMPYYPAAKPHRWFTDGTAGMIEASPPRKPAMP